MIAYETDKIIEEPFKSFLQKYKKGLEKRMKGSELVLDSVDILQCHEISLVRGGSYIDSPKWLKNKKATINPKNNDDKCFQYEIAFKLNYKQIKGERISKMKPFIDLERNRFFITWKRLEKV